MNANQLNKETGSVQEPCFALVQMTCVVWLRRTPGLIITNCIRMGKEQNRKGLILQLGHCSSPPLTAALSKRPLTPAPRKPLRTRLPPLPVGKRPVATRVRPRRSCPPVGDPAPALGGADKGTSGCSGLRLLHGRGSGRRKPSPRPGPGAAGPPSSPASPFGEAQPHAPLFFSSPFPFSPQPFQPRRPQRGVGTGARHLRAEQLVLAGISGAIITPP